jgi:8-oxo-dGTP pyrophosphatase MutT (NUDIX family)
MTVTNVLAAVIERGGRYLVCQRPAHKRHGGLWEFPGGKLEAGESYLDAARREMSEELGVGVVSVDEPLASFTDPGSPCVIDFVPVVIDGDPQCLEHSAVKWRHLVWHCAMYHPRTPLSRD